MIFHVCNECKRQLCRTKMVGIKQLMKVHVSMMYLVMKYSYSFNCPWMNTFLRPTSVIMN